MLLHFFVRQGTPLGDRLFAVGDLLADIDLVHHLVPGGTVGKLFGEPADFVFDGDHPLIVTPVRSNQRPRPSSPRPRPQGTSTSCSLRKVHLRRPKLPGRSGGFIITSSASAAPRAHGQAPRLSLAPTVEGPRPLARGRGLIRTVVYLHPDERKALKLAAVEREVAASEIMREALRRYLKIPD